jgi:predicted RNase H-like HicB family nuclease
LNLVMPIFIVEKWHTIKVINMQKWVVTIEKDEDGWYIAECPSIPGCVSQGQTEEEALENIKDAIIECLQVRAEEGLPISVKTYTIEVAA